MSPAWNMLYGDAPMTSYSAGGATAPVTTTPAGKLGGRMRDGRDGTPLCLGGFLILAFVIIAGIHFLGVRTNFTVAVGK